MTSRSKRRTGSRQRHTKGRGVSPVLPLAIVVAVLMTAGIVIPQVVEAQPTVASVVVYVPPDAQSARATIPNEMVDALTDIANDHDSIMAVRVEGDGSVTSSTVDLTPRTSSGEVLKVPERISEAIQASIAALVEEINRPSPDTKNRALYQGLLQARIPANTPVWVLAPGIDTAAPVDARDLAWEVPVDDVIETVNAAEAVPDMEGATVTFIMAAPAGQQQIRAVQTEYLHGLWTGLLKNAGASSVTFIDMPPGEPGSDQNVPVVPLPDLPGTPVPVEPDPVEPEVIHCTVKTSAGFVPDHDTLLDEDAVRASLADCVARMTPGSQVHLDGWVAYFGEIGPDGKPTTEGDVGLSQRRCDRIKALLVDMGVPEDAITTKGWGAVNQPNPEHPTSQDNRVVVITVTPPEKAE